MEHPRLSELACVVSVACFGSWFACIGVHVPLRCPVVVLGVVPVGCMVRGDIGAILACVALDGVAAWRASVVQAGAAVRTACPARRACAVAPRASGKCQGACRKCRYQDHCFLHSDCPQTFASTPEWRAL